MRIDRKVRFSMGEHTAWSLGIETQGGTGYVDTVHIGFYWRDKPFPTHDITIPAEEFYNGLEELRLVHAQASSERESSRDSSEEELSPDEVFRAWSSAYARPKEEPTTTRGESSGVRRSDGENDDGFFRDPQGRICKPPPGF